MKRRTFLEMIAAVGCFRVFQGLIVDPTALIQQQPAPGHPIGGTFTLSAGDRVTAPIQWDATIEIINSKLAEAGISITIKE